MKFRAETSHLERQMRLDLTSLDLPASGFIPYAVSAPSGYRTACEAERAVCNPQGEASPGRCLVPRQEGSIENSLMPTQN